MSKKYASQLRLEVNPSTSYQIIVWILSCVILLSIFIVDINSFFLKPVVTLVFLIYVFYTLSNNRARMLHWQTDAYWLIEQEHKLLDDFFHIKSQLRAELLGGSVVTTFLSVLNFKSVDGKKFSVVIFNDSIDEQDYRKLRLKLKLEGAGVSTRDTL